MYIQLRLNFCNKLLSILYQTVFIFQNYINYSFLINLTSNTISDRIDCAQRCLQYEMCQTATYYKDIQMCSLYDEKSDIGQILSVGNQANFVLTMISREPTCA